VDWVWIGFFFLVFIACDCDQGRHGRAQDRPDVGRSEDSWEKEVRGAAESSPLLPDVMGRGSLAGI
jgi:hypothetical protein